MRSIVIWSSGVLLCGIFVLGLWPIEWSGGKWWSMPIRSSLAFFFLGICAVILGITFAADCIAGRYANKEKKKL